MMIGLIVSVCLAIYIIGVVASGVLMSDWADDSVVGFICATVWPITLPFFLLYRLQLAIQEWREKRKRVAREKPAPLPTATVVNVHNCTDLNCPARSK